MKKWLCVLLLLSLSIGLVACARKKEPENPVLFYYRTAKVDFFADAGVIESEARDAGSRSGDYEYLLNQYLQGPEGQKLDRTFPAGTAVRSFVLTENSASILLTESFAQLTDMDLSLACACLTLTICQMTGVKQVQIRAESALLGGSEAVIMDYEQLILEDLCRVPVEPN